MLKRIIITAVLLSRALSGVMAAGPDCGKMASVPHPRLYATDKDIKEIRQMANTGSNPYVAAIYEGMLETVKKLDLDKNKALHFVPDGIVNPLSQSREFINVILPAAALYRIDRDKEYVNMAVPVIEYFCDNFDEWMETTPIKAFIIDCEFAFGLAVAYDWMYKDLPASTKAKMVGQMKKRCLDHPWKESIGNNRSQVCNASWMACAVSCAEHLDAAQMPDRWEERIDNLRKSMVKIYAPDGAASESPSYWSYGNMYQGIAMMTLNWTFGTDFGLIDIQGFRKTLDYHLFSQSNIGNWFSYGDCNPRIEGNPVVWYYAWLLGQPDATFFEAPRVLENHYANSRSALLGLLYAAKAGKNFTPKAPEARLYSAGGTAPVIIARNGWTKQDAYLGIKGGSPASGHSHMDEGSFIYDAYGQRWGADYPHKAYQRMRNIMKKLGAKFDYKSIDGPTWAFFYLNNKQHSTLTVNGHRQNPVGNATIVSTFDEGGRRGGTFDLSSNYDLDLSRAVRTAALNADGSADIKDEITVNEKGEALIRWTLCTTASIDVKKDCVILTSGGVKMMLKTDAPGAEYKSWPNEPTRAGEITSPYETDQKVPGYGFCGFEFRLPAGASASVTTSFRKQ